MEVEDQRRNACGGQRTEDPGDGPRLSLSGDAEDEEVRAAGDCGSPQDRVRIQAAVPSSMRKASTTLVDLLGPGRGSVVTRGGASVGCTRSASPRAAVSVDEAACPSAPSRNVVGQPAPR